MSPVRLLVLLAGSGTAAAVACSCSNEALAPVCQRISVAQVVFLGSIRSSEWDPNDPHHIFRNYRFSVKTAYKGLPPGTKEIVIDPGHGICEREYKQNAEYIIFGQKLQGSDLIRSDGCSGSRPVEYFPEDRRFLEAFRRHSAGSFVFGNVFQNRPDNPYYDPDAVPLKGARVILEGDENRLTALSDSRGAFRFEGIKPGNYVISANRDPFIPEHPSWKIAVPAEGCATVFPVLQAQAALSGTVKKLTGTPAVNTTIELVRKAEHNTTPEHVFRTLTNSRGQFEFHHLPAGDYLLGNEIFTGQPSTSNPLPTYYYPNSRDRQHAANIHLDPLQSITDVDFTLPKPDTRRRIRIKVTWPDGTSPRNHLLQLMNGSELLKNVGDRLPGQSNTNHRGIVIFDGYSERAYDFHVKYWVDDLRTPGPVDLKRIALSDHVRVQPGKQSITVNLVLVKEKLAAADEQ